jgi:hypothetical protein
MLDRLAGFEVFKFEQLACLDLAFLAIAYSSRYAFILLPFQ